MAEVTLVRLQAVAESSQLEQVAGGSFFHLFVFIFQLAECWILVYNSHQDAVAEWLRRWTANPFGFPSEGSNPFCVDTFFIFIFDILLIFQ